MPGDVLIGLPSAGLHTNGYSLARRVFFDVAGLQPDTFVRELGATAGDALLAPHRCYLPFVRPLLERAYVKGLAHITGGGITENLPRILPEGCAAEIDRRAWIVPPIFQFIQDRGGVAGDDMYRTFNMGVGLIIACTAREEERVVERPGGRRRAERSPDRSRGVGRPDGPLRRMTKGVYGGHGSLYGDGHSSGGRVTVQVGRVTVPADGSPRNGRARVAGRYGTFSPAIQSTGMGIGQRVSSPCSQWFWRRHKLPHLQVSARDTRPALRGFRSTYRHAVSRCSSVSISTALYRP